MVNRKIIEIDEEKCTGCGLCIPNCPEGALQVIDGKARVVSDLFCDGLGVCVGHCPEGAMKIVEREAEPYDEVRVMKNIVKAGPNTIKAHLKHLRDHGEEGYLKEAKDFLKENGIDVPLKEKKNMLCGCPGSNVMDLRRDRKRTGPNVKIDSELTQWPVQLMLVPPNAPYLHDAELLITADCVPFAYANFHQDFLKGKQLVIGCPKLDDVEFYIEKLTQIMKMNNIKSITLVHMEVPCCFGLKHAVDKAVEKSGKKIIVSENVVSVNGDINKQ